MTKSDEQLKAEFSAATEGLFFMSETDAPFENSFVPQDTDLSGDSLRRMAGKNPDAPVEQRALSDFFRAPMKEYEGQNEIGRAAAARFRNLYSLIESELSDVRVFRVGEINIAALIVGRAPSGNFIVLRTDLVET
jgi:Nuclease A inhibitor-like protein